MSQPLDAVIRRVNWNEETTDSNQQIFVIDSGGNVNSRSIFDRFTSNKHYIVSHSQNRPKNVSNFETSNWLPMGDGKISVNIKFKCQVQCKPGNEPRVARVLSRENTPTITLDTIITDYLLTAAGQKSAEAFFNNFLLNRQSLVTELIKDLEQSTGLSVSNGLIHIENESIALEPLDFNILIDTKVKSLPDQYTLGFKGSLDICEELKMTAIANYHRRHLLETILRQNIGKFFRHNVSMQSLRSEKWKVEENLRVHLNELLRCEGRTFDSIFVDFYDPFPERETNIEEEMLVTIPNYDSGIKIRIRVLLNEIDAAKYVLSGATDLTVWLKETLRRIAKRDLFDSKYEEFVRTEFIIKEKIEKALIIEAAKIGYAVHNLITIPDLPQKIWLEKIDIAQQDIPFRTKNNQVPITLNISLRTKLLNYERVDIRDNVPDVIKDSIVKEIQHYLDAVEPEQCYRYFSESKTSFERPVEVEITERIREVLKNSFNASVTSLTISFGRSEITDKYQAMIEKIVHFEINVRPLQGIDEVPYKGSFKVTAVDSNGWQTFVQTKFDLNDVKTCVMDSIKTKFAGKNLKELTTNSPNRDLYPEAKKCAHDAVGRMFGLSIDLFEQVFDRDSSEIEKTLQNAIKTQLIAQIKNQHQLLVQLDEARVTAELADDDDGASLLRDKIKRIQSETVVMNMRLNSMEFVEISPSRHSGELGAGDETGVIEAN